MFLAPFLYFLTVLLVFKDIATEDIFVRFIRETGITFLERTLMLNYLQKRACALVVVFAHENFALLVVAAYILFSWRLQTSKSSLYGHLEQEYFELTDAEIYHFYLNPVIFKGIKALNNVRLELEKHNLIKILNFPDHLWQMPLEIPLLGNLLPHLLKEGSFGLYLSVLFDFDSE